MICRNLDPIIHMLKLLYDLGVITHMEIEVRQVAQPVDVLGNTKVEDWTNPMIDVTIYE